MSNKLKQSLVEKISVQSSPDFDSRFFEKLSAEQKRPKIFASWLRWAISGCATASVLFIAINSYRVPTATFNHREYVETVLEIQSSMTEDVASDEISDLTSSFVDEI